MNEDHRRCNVIEMRVLIDDETVDRGVKGYDR
jgi:hypothetical protein